MYYGKIWDSGGLTLGVWGFVAFETWVSGVAVILWSAGQRLPLMNKLGGWGSRYRSKPSMHSVTQKGDLSMPSLGEQQEIQRKTSKTLPERKLSHKLCSLLFALSGVGEGQQ